MDAAMFDAALEMPTYACHKRVRAAVVTGIDLDVLNEALTVAVRLPDGSQRAIPVPSQPFAFRKPEVGDYLVRDARGAISWAKKAAFERDYALATEM